MPEQLVRARWVSDSRDAGMMYFPEGFYDPMVQRDPTINIPHTAIPLLVEALDTYGFIRPRLDTRLRDGDLQIIERLLDVVELQVRANGRRQVPSVPPPGHA